MSDDKEKKSLGKPAVAGDPKIQALIEELNQINLDDGTEAELAAKHAKAQELRRRIHGET